MSDDEAITVGSQPAGDWSIHDAGSPADSVKSDAEDDDKAGDAESAPSQPIQKRRRVTRACDECRRKKIKCDGKQPCTHCSVYSYGAYHDLATVRSWILLSFGFTMLNDPSLHLSHPAWIAPISLP